MLTYGKVPPSRLQYLTIKEQAESTALEYPVQPTNQSTSQAQTAALVGHLTTPIQAQVPATWGRVWYWEQVEGASLMLKYKQIPA